MKKTRHRKIVEIIEKRDVETQEELAGYLKDEDRKIDPMAILEL